MDFIIDEEFRQANRKQTKQERLNQEMMIEAEGCQDHALTVAIFGTQRFLADGFNTVEICKAKGIKLTDPRCIIVHSREEILDWIHRKQRSRRNLSAEEMAENREKRIERVVQARQEGKSTRVIAVEEGVSHSTVLDDVRKATGKGLPVDPPNGKVTGKDGRKKPSTNGKASAEHGLVIIAEKAKENGKPKGDAYEGTVAKPKKAGSVKFDFKEFEKHFGYVARGVDALANAYDQKRSDEHKECEQLLTDFARTWEKWKKKVTSIK